MLRMGTDENVDGDLVRGLLRRMPGLDIVRSQDAGLRTADDPAVLAWAAAEGRILVTHDRATMPRFAYDRVIAGQPLPGLFVVDHRCPIGQAIDDLALLAECSDEGEWEGRVLYLPL